MRDYAEKENANTNADRLPEKAKSVNGIPNSILNDVFAGKAAPSAQMMGHRYELAPSIAAKMAESFGMDISGVQIFRSDAMAGTEMHGMAQGNKVVLSSDVDLNTMEGQAVLGHELSHIRAQSMGIGSGNGLLMDGALEGQADREGMLAARGQSVNQSGMYTGMAMHMGLGMAGVENVAPLSAGLGAFAAAPMQASVGKDEKSLNEEFDKINWLENENDTPKQQKEKFSEAKERGQTALGYGGNENRTEKLRTKFTGYKGFNKDISFSGGRKVQGLNPGRMNNHMNSGLTKDYSYEEVENMLGKLLAGGDKEDAGSEKYDAEKIEGMIMYKKMLHKRFKKMESDYGTMVTDMHPDDVFKRIGMDKFYADYSISQDSYQITDNIEDPKLRKQVFNDQDPEDRDFERLRDYYAAAFSGLKVYLDGKIRNEKEFDDSNDKLYTESASIELGRAKKYSRNIAGKKMSPEQKRKYENVIRHRPNKYNQRINMGFNPVDNVQWTERADSKRKEEETSEGFKTRGAKESLRANKKGQRIIDKYSKLFDSDLQFSDGPNGEARTIHGFNPKRMLDNLGTSLSSKDSEKSINEMLDNMGTGRDKETGQVGKLTAEDDEKIFAGALNYKRMMFDQLKRMQKNYGTLLTQMNKDDAVKRFGAKKYAADVGIVQDMEQFMHQDNGEYINNRIAPKDENGNFINEEDREMDKLIRYYGSVFTGFSQYLTYLAADEMDSMVPGAAIDQMAKDFEDAKMMENEIDGPGMNEEELAEYNKSVQERIKNGELRPDIPQWKEQLQKQGRLLE